MSGTGWYRFPWEESVALWANHAASVAQGVLADPQNSSWYRGEGTWFVGVDCLPNDPSGRLAGGPPFSGVFQAHVSSRPLHPAQLSAVFPSYPKPIKGESEAAARYRLNRDGAHVDGLLPVGTERRRMIREPHAYILGLPLTESDPSSSPLVVWEGSQDIMRHAFRNALTHLPGGAWADVDLTNVYHLARREAFDTCKRVELAGRPGEALLLDPMLLHGIAPWRSSEKAARVVAYFRPVTSHQAWLNGGGIKLPGDI